MSKLHIIVRFAYLTAAALMTQTTHISSLIVEELPAAGEVENNTAVISGFRKMLLASV